MLKKPATGRKGPLAIGNGARSLPAQHSSKKRKGGQLPADKAPTTKASALPKAPAPVPEADTSALCCSVKSSPQGRLYNASGINLLNVCLQHGVCGTVRCVSKSRALHKGLQEHDGYRCVQVRSLRSLGVIQSLSVDQGVRVTTACVKVRGLTTLRSLRSLRVSQRSQRMTGKHPQSTPAGTPGARSTSAS